MLLLDHHSSRVVFVVGAGLVALSSLPGVAAEEDNADKPKPKEDHNLQPGLVIAVSLVIFTIVLLPVGIFYYVRRMRWKSAAANKEVAVEASQMEGPPTVLRATYDPGSGHSIYAIGSAGSGAYPTAVVPPTPEGNSSVMGLPGTPGNGMTPAFPTPSVPGYHPSGAAPHTMPRTAPAHKSTFSQSSSSGQRSAYPFGGMGSTQPPKSALVSAGPFPRPLIAGRSLKDRIRERPPSVSSLGNEFEAPKSGK